MSISVGIDVGAEGAIAFLREDGRSPVVYPMPWIEHVGIDDDRLRAMLPPGQLRVFVERVQTRLGQGIAQALSMGIQYGGLLKLLKLLGHSVQEVPAQRWKAALGLADPRAKRRGVPREPKPVYAPKSPEARAAARAARDAGKLRKARAIALAQSLFPGVSLLPTPNCKKPSDGMAEALLIAEYGRRLLNGVKD